MAIESVTFLQQQPMNARNRHRFGVEILRRNGFPVRCYDFSPLVFPGKTAGEPEEADCDTVSSRDQGHRILTGLSSRTFVIADIGLSPTSDWIFRQLSRQSTPYAVMSLGALPGEAAIRASETGIRARWAGRRRITPGRVLRRATFAVRAGRVKAARWCLLGGAESACSLTAPAAGAETIWVHALDYDRYLEHDPGPAERLSEDAIVFLDQCLPYHPDSTANPPVTADEYYPAMSRLFDGIEDQFGLPVIVAAHPKARYADPGPFGNRRIVRENTIDLVRRARLVVAHHTTAVNFAVLYDRPIIFVDTDQLARTKWSLYLHNYADRLGLPVVNADHFAGRLPDPEPDRITYDRFVHAFITTRRDDRRPTWQIVADQLNACNHAN